MVAAGPEGEGAAETLRPVGIESEEPWSPSALEQVGGPAEPHFWLRS